MSLLLRILSLLLPGRKPAPEWAPADLAAFHADVKPVRKSLDRRRRRVRARLLRGGES